MSPKVDYNAMSQILSSLPGWTNELNDVPHLREDEIEYTKQLSDSDYRKMLRPKQKNTDLLRDIVFTFTKPGDGVLDAFCGTLCYRLSMLIVATVSSTYGM